MKCRCLVVDHDDTVVNSTATIHYPSFVAFEKLRGREIRHSLEDYFLCNFDPGVIGFFRDIIGMNEAEMQQEQAFWKDFVAHHVPEVYPGMKELLWDVKRSGMLLCVDSHSFSEHILRDYRENGLPAPDMVFGWELPHEKRKPAPWSLEKIMQTWNLKPEELLVLDDLKPGCDMAHAAGVPVAGAGWGYDIPEIERIMRKNCDHYFKTVPELREFLFREDKEQKNRRRSP